MPQDSSGAVWRVGGASRRGASHIEAGMPNQDALRWWTPNAGAGPPAIVAVADGHGGEPHFRSAIGAQFAVDAAVQALRAALQFLGGRNDSAWNERLATLVRHELVGRWRTAVAQHLQAHPFTDEELVHLASREGKESLARASGTPTLAYGSTVLAALQTDRGTLLVQLGDGDILCVGASGAAMLAFERDPRFVQNITTSLCQADAEHEMHVAVIPRGPAAPVVVLLATDGYANSFRNDTDFPGIGAEYLETLTSLGFRAVMRGLPGRLDDLSTAGSGDDITLGVLTSVGVEPPNEWSGSWTAVPESTRRVAPARLAWLSRKRLVLVGLVGLVLLALVMRMLLAFASGRPG